MKPKKKTFTISIKNVMKEKLGLTKDFEIKGAGVQYIRRDGTEDFDLIVDYITNELKGQ